MKAILTYHSIDDSESPISLSVATFRRHARFLAEGRIAVVPLQDILDVDPRRDAVAITFDDGFSNFATEAWPVLRSHGLPATVFIAVEHVGRTNRWREGSGPPVPELPLMDWDTLGRMADAGVAIGSHTRTHADLRRLPADRLAEEVEGAADALRRRLGVEAVTFAYPFGAWDAPSREAVGRVHSIAVTTRLAVLPSRGDIDPLLLPRLDAYYYRRVGRLERWGAPSFRAHLRLRRAARSVRTMLHSCVEGR